MHRRTRNHYWYIYLSTWPYVWRRISQPLVGEPHDSTYATDDIFTARKQCLSLAKKPDLPQIQHDANDSDWALFVDSWTRYKTMARLHNADEIRNELRAACSKEIDKLLFNFIGADVLNSSTEEELLNHIKSVAVRGLHKEVHRQTFQSIRQKEGEPVTHFLARLRSQADFCEFSVKCSNTPDCGRQISYAEDMISGQLIAGLINNEHQSRLLA